MKANEVIRMRRKELGYTMKEIANAVGVSGAASSSPSRQKTSLFLLNICNG